MKTESSSCTGKFHTVAGFSHVFDPSCLRSGTVKKHPCSDCHFCQGCAESRCQACRSQGNGCRVASSGKLSMREQITLYESLNQETR